MQDSLFANLGDSAVCLVGSLNTTVGTQRNLPYECRVHNNVVHDCGYFGKQVAGVYISRAKRITVSHNEMYSMPRAGICIGDGTWGGHVIEHNSIHDTCRETGDHGPFNAWGRDKYWCLVQSHTEYLAERNHDRYFRNITVMSKGRMKTEDDLNFSMGAGGGEIYTLIAPPVRSSWLEECDHNCFFSDIGEFRARVSSRIPARNPEDADPQRAGSFHLGERTTCTLAEWQEMGYDRNSVFADPMFVDPEHDDYCVKPESPALQLGFENFAMDQFGPTADYPATWEDA